MRKKVSVIIRIMLALALLGYLLPCDTHGHDDDCALECSCVSHSPTEAALSDITHLFPAVTERLLPTTKLSTAFSFSARIFRPPIT